MGELAKADPETRILFGIEKFKGFLYREIHTIGKQEFLEEYEKKCRLIND